jgi:hypothetical protein
VLWFMSAQLPGWYFQIAFPVKSFSHESCRSVPSIRSQPSHQWQSSSKSLSSSHDRQNFLTLPEFKVHSFEKYLLTAYYE